MNEESKKNYKKALMEVLILVFSLGLFAVTGRHMLKLEQEERQEIEQREKSQERRNVDRRLFKDKIKESTYKERELSKEWYLNCKALVEKVSKDDNFKLITELIEDDESKMYYDSEVLFELLEKLDKYPNIDENIDDALLYDSRAVIKMKLLDIIRERMCIIHK